MARIEMIAWAVPIGWAGGTIQHTYVKVGDRCYPCFGRCKGGRPLEETRGFGEDDLAHCYSKHDSESGLYYGITGVCHQAANRIIAETGKFVALAPHFRCASIFYLHWGLDWDEESYDGPKPPWVHDWMERVVHCSDSNRDNFPKRPTGGTFLEMTKRRGGNLRQYLLAVRRVLNQLRAERGDRPAGRRDIAKQIEAEVEMMMRYRLNPKDLSRHGSKILDAALESYDDRAEIARDYLRGECDRPEFADRINGSIAKTLERLRFAIPGGCYVDMLGIPFSEDVQLVDPGAKTEATAGAVV